MAVDKYDLEHDIMEVWAIKEHIQTLIWRMFDHSEMMSQDEIFNQIFAVENMVDLRCNKLMDTYCRVFQLNEYAPDEVKEYRAQVLKELTEQHEAKPKKKAKAK
jgi:hypothetical protein